MNSVKLYGRLTKDPTIYHACGVAAMEEQGDRRI